MTEQLLPNASQFTTGNLLRSPATGIVTAVSTSAVELKAGGSAVANRVYLRVKNLSEELPARIGDASVTQKAGGVLLEPLGTLEIHFLDEEAVSVYARSTGYAIKLEVTES